MFYLILLPWITAFTIVLLSTPSFIRVAHFKHLFDSPDEERKIHRRSVPLMGGIMIFAGTVFSMLFWYPSAEIGIVKHLLPALLILFFIGIKDDIIGTAAMKKLLAQIIVAFIMVFVAKIRITGMHGLFGVEQIPDWLSYALSLFTYIVAINAYNLIDGVDGLAGGVGLIASTCLGVWFFLTGNAALAVIAFALSGALLAFLRFNFQPAQIFMGDSGSLTIGLLLITLTIAMIEQDTSNIPGIFSSVSKPLLGMAVLSYPLIDTLRIFAYRAYKGLPPFQADQNHIHHRLIKCGLNHAQTVLSIYLYQALLIGFVLFFHKIDATVLFFGLLGFIVLSIIALFSFNIKKC